MNRPVENRYDFVLFFDVVNGNPNGDPDAGNRPRIDFGTNHGLVTDVALKRKVRNYVALTTANRIYISEGATLNFLHREAWAAVMPEVTKAEDFKRLPKNESRGREITAWMCANFWDVRTFGAVMSTGANAGQVRGPVQFTFARSVEPIMPLEVTITRLSATTEKEAEEKGTRTMGRKHIVPYGLYRMHGYVSAALASHPIKGTGFSEGDLELLWNALGSMFEHDRSAARGEMTTRKLIIFKHESLLGNAPAGSLFDRVQARRVHRGAVYMIGSVAAENLPPARSWADYEIVVNAEALPPGVKILDSDRFNRVP